MKDRDFLIWLHERLERLHEDNPHNAHMHKLRDIIAATPADQETPAANPPISLEDLKEKLKEPIEYRYFKVYCDFSQGDKWVEGDPEIILKIANIDGGEMDYLGDQDCRLRFKTSEAAGKAATSLCEAGFSVSPVSPVRGRP